jgi:hypothetical protein
MWHVCHVEKLSVKIFDRCREYYALMMFCSTLKTTMGACTPILAMSTTRGKKKTVAALERKSR